MIMEWRGKYMSLVQGEVVAEEAAMGGGGAKVELREAQVYGDKTN